MTVVADVDLALADDEAPADAAELPSGFHSDVPVIPFNVNTEEPGWNRVIESLGFDTFPLPLMLMVDDNHGAMPTQQSHLCGNITGGTVGDDGLYVTGTFDLESEWGREAARVVRDNVLRSVSADVRASEVAYEEVSCADSGVDDGPGMLMCMRETVRDGTLMGLTLVPFPAFEAAEILPDDAMVAAAGPGYVAVRFDLSPGMLVLPGAESVTAAAALEVPVPVTVVVNVVGDPTAGEVEAVVDAVTAAAVPPAPPAEWFEDPGFRAPTPLHVGDDGRVYGHIAAWNTCHTSRQDVCLMAPRSVSGYAYFRIGETRLADGGRVRTGPLTVGTGHADLSLGHRAAASHYDNTGSVVADVASGEDAHGIWVAGALRPAATEDQVRALMASAPSGDWRAIGGSLEMVAVLMVPVPGFPVVDLSLAASAALAEWDGRVRLRVEDGECMALVAAGRIPPSDPVAEMRDEFGRRLTALESAIAGLAPVRMNVLRERMGRGTASA